MPAAKIMRRKSAAKAKLKSALPKLAKPKSAKPQYIYLMASRSAYREEKLTLHRWADVATVTVLVGENKKAFHIHEANLFEVSTFFKAAFSSDFKEGSERIMTLPEDDDSVFELFVEWIYRGRYKLPSIDLAHKRHIQLFVLADKYDVPDLKSLVLSELFSLIKNREFWPSRNTIVYAYEHTSQNAPVRKMIADHLARDWSSEFEDPNVHQVWLQAHPDVSADVVISFIHHRRGWPDICCGDIAEEDVKKEQASGD